MEFTHFAPNAVTSSGMTAVEFSRTSTSVRQSSVFCSFMTGFDELKHDLTTPAASSHPSSCVTGPTPRYAIAAGDTSRVSAFKTCAGRTLGKSPMVLLPRSQSLRREFALVCQCAHPRYYVGEEEVFPYSKMWEDHKTLTPQDEKQQPPYDASREKPVMATWPMETDTPAALPLT